MHRLACLSQMRWQSRLPSGLLSRATKSFYSRRSPIDGPVLEHTSSLRVPINTRASSLLPTLRPRPAQKKEGPRRLRDRKEFMTVIFGTQFLNDMVTPVSLDDRNLRLGD